MTFLSIIAGLISCSFTAVADALAAICGVSQRQLGLTWARFSSAPARYGRSTRIAIRPPTGG